MRIWTPSQIKNKGYFLHPVNYSPDRPLVDLTKMPEGRALPGSAFGSSLQSSAGRDGIEPFLHIAFTKHEDWCYEEEWRMVCSQKDDEDKIDLLFPEDSLVSVVLGLRMPKEQRQCIRYLIQTQERNTVVLEAREDHSRFRIIAE